MQEAAKSIGEKLGLPHSELHRLQLLITLHDIGKINIPEELLTQKGSLTATAWEVMKKHCETGYRIARATESFAHVPGDILSHHERWDGSGYPQGLKGEAIPILARITAIADAFEVMSNGRPYKHAKLLEDNISVDKLIVFGSVVRNEADDESDLDLLVVTREKFSRVERHKITDQVFDVNLKYGTNISSTVVDKYSWENGYFSILPIKDEIEREGVLI